MAELPEINLPKIADSPHPLSLWSDFAKTLITIETAVLGVSGVLATAFSLRLSSMAWLTLVASWVVLVAALGSSIYTIGGITSLARTDITTKRTFRNIATWSNCSFYFTFAAFALLMAFAIIAGASDNSNDAASAFKAGDGVPVTCAQPQERAIRSATINASGVWTVDYSLRCGAKPMKTLEMKFDRGRITQVHLF